MNTDPKNPVTHEDISSLKAEIRELRLEIRNYTRALFDPEQPEKGFVVRVDRLERTQAFLTKLGWSVAGAAVTAVAASLWALLAKAGHPH